MHSFSNKRGAKLSEGVCACGGKLELMTMRIDPVTIPSNEVPEGIDPFDKTIHDDGTTTVYPRGNRMGQIFLFSRAKQLYTPFNNPSSKSIK